MSWDVLLINGSSSITKLEQLNNQIIPEFGAKTDVVHKLEELFPDISFTDRNWGYIHRLDFSIEFNIGEKDAMDALMLHIRGGDDVINEIRAICDLLGCKAFDTTTGGFINFENDPARGLREWRGYRDKVIAHLETRGKKF